MKVNVIAAIDRHGAIGRENVLPWKCKTDMEYFRQCTMGCPIVMGRKTFEGLSFPLKGRDVYVLTHQIDYARLDHPVPLKGFGRNLPELVCRIASNYDVDATCWIVGGQLVYEEALSFDNFPMISEVHLNQIDTVITNPDAWFPMLQLVHFATNSITEQIDDSASTSPHKLLSTTVVR